VAGPILAGGIGKSQNDKTDHNGSGTRRHQLFAAAGKKWGQDRFFGGRGISSTVFCQVLPPYDFEFLFPKQPLQRGTRRRTGEERLKHCKRLPNPPSL
jgi:hypothetical protein